MRYLAYCIYGTRAGDLPDLPRGVAAQSIEALTAQDLGVAVSQVSDAGLITHPDPENLLAFEQVVAALHQDRAVLPLRYGCVFEDRDEGVDLLVKRQAAYQKALTDLDGCAEMGLRILSPVQPVEDTPPPEGVSGRSYLLQRKSYFETQDPSPEVVGMCCDAFSGLFVKHRVETYSALRPALGSRLLSLYFLVRWEVLDTFRHVYQSLSKQAAAKMLLSGPWPPYNFVSADPAVARRAIDLASERR